MTTKNLERLAWGVGALVAVMTAFLVITSCNSEAIVDPAGGKNADLVIDATIEGASETKASTNLHESAFASGDVIQVYMWDTTDESNVTELVNTIVTYNGTSWSPSSITGVIPITCTQGDVLGIYPTGKFTLTAANRNASFQFEVADGQYSDVNYNASDLMVAHANPDYNYPTATLKFKHLMSKLIFNFKNSAGTTVKVSQADLINVRDVTTVSNLAGVTPTVTTTSGSNVDFCILSGAGASSTAVILPPQKLGTSSYATCGHHQYRYYLQRLRF